MSCPHPSLELLPLVEPVLATLPDLDWAIGGAAAMALHGYSRHTEDLDVFFHGGDVNRVLLALRRAGVRFATIADPFHYAVFPDLRDPDRRIDLLFAWDKAENDAVSFPEEKTLDLGGRQTTVRYFPLLLLVAAKLISDRPRDHDDVARLWERGLFAPAEARTILERLGADPEALMRLDAAARPAGPGGARGSR